MLTKLNPLKRRVLKRLTRNLGGSYTSSIPVLDPTDELYVLISRPNHRLGNLLLITPLIEEITSTFPKAKIDLFVKGGLPNLLFEEHPNINRIIKLPRKPFKELRDYLKIWLLIRKNDYDLVINIDRGSSSGTLCTSLANSRYKIFGEHIKDIPPHLEVQRHIAKNPVYAFRNFVALSGLSTSNPVPSLTLRLTEDELSSGKKIVEDLVLNPEKKTVCLFTYATGEKCYTKDWWEIFYKILEENLTDYNFIEVLPVENISNLSFRIPHFYTKDVRELASVIANTCLFIGADSGVMHLASSVRTPTIGLFSVSNEKKYAPYAVNNIALKTTATTPEVWIRHITKIIEATCEEKNRVMVQG